MMAYLIHASILLSGFTIFYYLLLRNETFFSLNRWTFVLCIILSLTLPTISIPASLSLQDKVLKSEILNPGQWAESSGPKSGIEANIKYEETGTEVVAEESTTLTLWQKIQNWPLKTILLAIYIVGASIFLIVFLVQLLILLTRKYNLTSYKTGKYTIVELVKDHEPYSFMNTIFINPASYDPETYDQIIEHEKLHIDQAHFIDKLLAEFLVIIFWFNPFVWLMRSSIGKNLEFLTDHSLLKNGLEKESYQMSLLKVSVSTKPFNLTTSYNNSFLKNRIIMMNSKKSSVASIWKYLFILPLFFLSMISLNAVNDGNTLGVAQNETQVNSPQNAPSSERGEIGTWKNLKPSNPANIENVKRELNLDRITSFNIANLADVVVRKSSTQKVVVEGPKELLDELNLDVEDGFWNIKIESIDDKNKKKRISVIISIDELNAATISGNGNIAGEAQFTATKDFHTAISGQGNIALDVISKHANCAISGHGNIALNGESKSLRVAVSGSGNITTLSLSADEVDVAVSGSAKIAVNAASKLSTRVSGDAEISYSGNPKISSVASGKADVKKID